MNHPFNHPRSAIAPNAVSPVVSRGPLVKPETYRGWAISFEYGYFYATSPNYDASYEGPEDGWVDNGERVCGRTIDDCHAEVDAWFEDNGQFGVGA